jgi:hypothetical protein
MKKILFKTTFSLDFEAAVKYFIIIRKVGGVHEVQMGSRRKSSCIPAKF